MGGAAVLPTDARSLGDQPGGRFGAVPHVASRATRGRVRLRSKQAVASSSLVPRSKRITTRNLLRLSTCVLLLQRSARS
jgi:hypothetical protein